MLCHCKTLLAREKIYVHLYGCPEDSISIQDQEKYDKLPWYKKLLERSPAELYAEHLTL